MTVKIDIELTVAGRRRGVLEALAHLEAMSTAIEVNGVEIDLRHSRLTPDSREPDALEEPGETEVRRRRLRRRALGWAPMGLWLQPIGTAALILGYAHPDALTVGAGMAATGTLSLGPHLILRTGDRVSVKRARAADLPDKGLSAIDQLRATAVVVVTRGSGIDGEQSEEPGGDQPVEITYGHPLAADFGPNGGWLTPSLNLMEKRLNLLRTVLSDSDSAPLSASSVERYIEQADRHRNHLDELQRGIDHALAQARAGGEILAQIRQTQIDAAAFGFALGLAEAESASRAAVRRVSRGQAAKATKSYETARLFAAEWHAVALKFVKRWTAIEPRWAGTASKRMNLGHGVMVTRIVEHLNEHYKGADYLLRGEASVSDWLKSVYDEPGCPKRRPIKAS